MATFLFIILAILIILLGVLIYENKKMDELNFKLLAHCQELQKGWDESMAGRKRLIEIAEEDSLRRGHMLYLLDKSTNALKYASAHLKPRKRDEMWHRANDIMTFEEWVKFRELDKETE